MRGNEVFLSEEDKRIFLGMKDDGTLQHVDVSHYEERFLRYTPIICADGDMAPEANNHLVRLGRESVGQQNHRSTPHALSLNGGPIRIPNSSPAYKEHASIALVEDAVESLWKKDMTTAPIIGHSPCLIAIEFQIGAIAYCHLLFQTKKIILEAAKRSKELGEKDIKSCCLIHLAWKGSWHDDSKKIYKIDRAGFYKNWYGG